MEALTDKQRILKDLISEQEEKVSGLEDAVKKATEAYGDGAVETERYRKQLILAKTELVKSQQAEKDVVDALKQVKQEGELAAEAIEDVGEAAGSAEGQTIGLAESLGTLKKVVAGGAIAVGAKKLAGAVLEIVDSTEEYRKIMGTLETSSEAAGYSADETAEAYSRLYGVLGDQQTTATTVANLQALSVSQDQLLDLIDQTTGAWAKYGDSIPIDGLSEAINETIRVGQVTGTFADVLNWGAEEGERYGVELREANEANEAWNKAVSEAKTAEDFFNLALQDAESQADRVNLVMQAMAAQGLNDMAEKWRENNEDIVAANEATDRWEQAMGRLGETLAPARDALKNFGADAVMWLTDQLEALIKKAEEAWDALTKGDLGNEKAKNMAASRGVDTEAANATAATAKKVRDLNAKTTKTSGNDNAAYAWQAAEAAESAARAGLQMPVTATREADSSAHAQMIADRAAAAAVAQAPKGGDIVINLTSEVGGTTVARHQYRFNQAESDRRGQAAY